MIGDKYKSNYYDYTVEVIFEDGEGKLLENISGTNIGFKFYILNSFLEGRFTLIKEPRKTEKRYIIVREGPDGSLMLENNLYSNEIIAEVEEIRRQCGALKFHDILEVQYTEKVW